MERHSQAVASIALAVRGFFERREPYRIFHGSTNSTRPQRTGKPVVDISALCNVLQVDRAARTVLVEPNVPMDKLVEITLKHGLVPPVVMEFPGITAGGGLAGTAGESSSFKHGFFNDTVNWAEIILGNGDVVRASREERADLFRGAAGAVGSLGVTTLLEIQLLEAKTFVRTTYHRTNSVSEAIARIRTETENPANDYVDGILFSKDHGVIVTGKMTDDKPSDAKIRTFSGPWDPWFYLHVQDLTRDVPTTANGPSDSASSSPVDFIPLAEYLFRYDRGGFWVGAAAFSYFKGVPFTRFFRWFLDDFLHTRMLYHALHASGESASFVVQDLGLPYRSAGAFIDYTAETFNIWPLWLCPLKQTPPPTFHPHTGETETAADGTLTIPPSLNIGLWGWGPVNPDEFVSKNRALEDKLVELGGRKWLYAHTYYNEEEFWKLYDRPWYDALRKKYHADTLPAVHDKVTVDVEARREERQKWKRSLRSMPPLGGLYGIWKGIQSKDYLLHRNAKWKYKE